ncbi:TIGR03862 family flavoprotein [Jiella sp. R10]|uniref:TIGR03862 family flavoprotein n=2 Tax=Antarcticirhabdus aurantiaca TaxID=2606717 RepID=A0ACD4NX71_9HYPH|nr:TIGR03862 family flavoprotein [Jeongeuplla avenae]
MAAEVLSAAGRTVTVYERMPTPGRKFLLAGKSGLNLTHAEPFERFAARFGAASPALRPALDAFTPDDLRAWAADLGVETFVGSSGRVFPREMKASPLLRAWRRRLEHRGVRLLTRHHWTGFDGAALRFETLEGEIRVEPAATLLALGGASWPRLGSDGAWAPVLEADGLPVRPLRPANCGFDVAWSDVMRERFAGEPVKAVTVRLGDGPPLPGEFVVTRHGVEGSLVYAVAAELRDRLDAGGAAALILDLAPGRTEAALAKALARQPASASFANRLRKGAGLTGVKAALLRELAGEDERRDAARLAARIKALELPVRRPRPIAEAISTAGGLAFDALDARFMAIDRPGLFLAGEMLDWEAPTGGYLLTACMATGRAAGFGIDRWLAER